MRPVQPLLVVAGISNLSVTVARPQDAGEDQFDSGGLRPKRKSLKIRRIEKGYDKIDGINDKNLSITGAQLYYSLPSYR